MKKLILTIVPGVGAAIAIGLLSWLEHQQSALALLMAPFGATTVLVFGVPDSPLAQPRNVIFGHLLTALIGVCFVQFSGVTPFTLSLATGLAVTGMLATGTTHPPVGANPLLIMMTGQGWSFLLSPVLSGAVVIVLLGWLHQRLRARARLAASA